MSDDAPTLPAPRPARCRTRIDEFGSQLELRSGRPGCAVFGLAGFLGLWLIGWSAGTVMLLGHVAADPSPFSIMFAVPFVAAWFAVAGALVYLLFGREWLSIGPDGLEYELRAIAPLRRRHIPGEELKAAVEALRHASSDSNHVAHCVRIETTGKPVNFGYALDIDETRWLVQRINEQLAGARPRGRLPFEQPADAAPAEPPRTRTGAEVLVPGARPPAPPSDCRFVVADDFERLRFVRPGRWSMAAIAGTTFVNLFWNGIVGVFVLELTRDFQWFLFFFLIPFEVIGLVMFAAWLLALAGPASRDSWSFGRDEIARRRSFLGLGWSRRYRIEPFDRIELERRVLDSGEPGVVDLTDAAGEYLLSFVSREQRIALQVKQLTEGEARWMAD